MGSWLAKLRGALDDSLWFLPGLLTVLLALLAQGLIMADQLPFLYSGDPPGWVYQGSAEGARALLSAITGSLITVTGVVFSVTIVAVQLASSQYTPRVLRNFTTDRGNQLVLGIFIGTFTYSMLVLRSVRAPDEGETFIPRLAITAAVVLVLGCMGALIYFIDHVARQIHVTAILERVTRQTVDHVHRLFPEEAGHADDDATPDPRRPEHASVTVVARDSGYLQFVDHDHLFAIGERVRAVIGMQPRLGEYVLQGRPLAEVWAERPVDEQLAEEIRKAFVLGPERTPQQDVEFGIVQISDIAIRALSPSVNDPTTAIRCIDRLGEILVELGRRNPPEPRRTKTGEAHFIARYTSFEDGVRVAFGDIRHFGAGIPIVVRRLLDVLAQLLELVPESRRRPLLDQGRAVLHTAREQIVNPRDVEELERAAERFEGGRSTAGDGGQEQTRR